MSHWENEPEHDEGLTEFEQMQLDQVILDTAYNNSYFVLIGHESFMPSAYLGYVSPIP